MKIVIVGGGGREHALAWKIARSPLIDELIVAPGNGGMGGIARLVPIDADDVEGQFDLAVRERADLVVVGPEAPLAGGLVDRLSAAGIRAFGPTATAARLEGSKVFAKEFMARHGVPTAPFSVHDDLGDALAAVDRRAGPCVVKADGLAAGKGVIVCRSPFEARQAVQRILGDRQFGEAGSRVVIEDLLAGEEASVLAICDGERIVPLLAAQDHKAAYEGDTGPNTGGMGAYAPAQVVTRELCEVIVETVLRRTVDGMARDGHPFRGVLYAGMMIRDGQPLTLEFNARFGDPECQPLMLLLEEDLVPLLIAAADGALEERGLRWRAGAALCVVLAAGGYPGPYERGKEISGLAAAAAHPDAVVFHAGTRLEGERVLTSGGRVLGVTGRGPTVEEAAARAYAAAGEIRWEGMRMRRDIGHRALFYYLRESSRGDNKSSCPL
jgi:phosphoribosylamine--glycine ligase